jgi:hypothetical protein
VITCKDAQRRVREGEMEGTGEDGRKGMLHDLRVFITICFCSYRSKPRKFCRGWVMCRKYFTRGK